MMAMIAAMIASTQPNGVAPRRNSSDAEAGEECILGPDRRRRHLDLRGPDPGGNQPEVERHEGVAVRTEERAGEAEHGEDRDEPRNAEDVCSEQQYARQALRQPV